MAEVIESNAYVRIVTVSALPAPGDLSGVLVVYSGKLYWSDGTTWHQVAPAQGGGGGDEHLVIGIITDGEGGGFSEVGELAIGIITD